MTESDHTDDVQPINAKLANGLNSLMAGAVRVICSGMESLPPEDRLALKRAIDSGQRSLRVELDFPSLAAVRLMLVQDGTEPQLLWTAVLPEQARPN